MEEEDEEEAPGPERGGKFSFLFLVLLGYLDTYVLLVFLLTDVLVRVLTNAILEEGGREEEEGG